MREVVLDTETTGLDPEQGHRIVEIGAVELIHHLPTGRTFHTYVNPERDVPADAERVHGLTAAFLARHPTFAEIVDDFLAFIADDPLVIHNAAFDLAFLNAELARCGRDPIPASRAVDTVALAREKFPGQPANLDALCRRFGIDASARTLHGALLDSQLLAEVYLHLLGGPQTMLALEPVRPLAAAVAGTAAARRPVRPPRPHAPTPEELAAHARFVAEIPDALWREEEGGTAAGD